VITFAKGEKPIRTVDGMWMLQGTLKGNTGLAVGIDPGVNFGMTVINMEYVQVIYGKLPTDKRPGWRGIYAYDYICTHFQLLNKAVTSQSSDLTLQELDWIAERQLFSAVVEGAAYHSRFGQVGLEEVRFGFFLALHHLGFKVSILAPASIRLIAFGSGKKQALDLWPAMNQNGADSIGCALAALEVKNGD
jgi:hypothetical protein